eukprot:gb/GECH01003103.1/.p1 GENE.gb/GECH01003103.1/~~gb/GECH01003103.1/.p1  ORF type:complete len:321 (+),score=48.37 gb/GECH01003103.1/:1-963(+)
MSELRVLTLNFFVRPPFITNNGNDYKTERLKHFVKHFADKFDLMCFQELFSVGSSHQKDLFNDLSHHGLSHHVTVPHSAWSLFNGKAIDSGLAICSRFPIIESDHLVFSSGTSVDKLASKGALYAKIETKNKENKKNILQVVTTHLQASYGSGNNTDVAAEQTQELHDFIQKKLKKHPSKPMIVVGDFNLNGRRKWDDGKTHTKKYKNLMEKLKFPGHQTHDVIYECIGEHPITINDYKMVDGERKPRETVLTNHDDFLKSGCLDYMFYIESHKDHGGVPYQPIYDSSGAKVERMFVRKQPFTQISDHYGLCMYLKRKPK